MTARRAIQIAVGLMLLSACGGGGASAFLGTYSNTGTDSWSGCAVPPASESGSATLVVVAGPSSNQITTEQQGCNLNWTVSGDTATLISGQTCTGTTNGTAWTLTYASGTWALSGSTLTGTATGSQVFENTSGAETCTLSQSGTATPSAQ
ncbi:MAG TPA: hypothetical protein VMB50_01865 [Myxococcales bacterium]|nr:hypothetical protein [Myxococcales bacterium]